MSDPRRALRFPLVLVAAVLLSCGPTESTDVLELRERVQELERRIHELEVELSRIGGWRSIAEDDLLRADR